MDTKNITVACLPLKRTPRLLFDVEHHEPGTCDHCGVEIVVPKCLELFEAEPSKSCPACIAKHLDLADELLAEFMYSNPAQC